MKGSALTETSVAGHATIAQARQTVGQTTPKAAKCRGKTGFQGAQGGAVISVPGTLPIDGTATRFKPRHLQGLDPLRAKGAGKRFDACCIGTRQNITITA